MSSQPLLIRIQGDASPFAAAMQEVRNQLEGGAKAVSNFSSKIGAMSSLGTTLSIGVTAPIVAMSTAVIRAALNMDQLKKGLETVEGSTTKAEAALQKLEIAARNPGLGFKEAIKGFTSLRAAGLDADLAQRSLSAFGNALATVGKGKAELDGVSLALQQIATKSKFSAEEVNQLAERVPQIRKAMQAAFGTADTEVIQKMGISNIEIIKRLVIELEKLPKAADSPKNALDNLTETIEKSADRIGKKMLPAVTELIPKVEKLVTGLADVLDGFTKLPDSIQTGALALVGLAIASGPLMKVVSGLRLIKDEILAIRAVAGASALAGAAGSAIDPFLRLSQRAIPGVAGAVGSAATTFSAAGAGIAAGGGLAVGAALYGLNNSTTALEQQKKAADEAAAGMKRLNDRFYEAKQPTNDAYEALVKHSQALADIPPKLKQVGDESQKTANIIKVTSVAARTSVMDFSKGYGQVASSIISKSSLIYVEGLERVKAGVGRAKDAVFDFIHASDGLGKKLELNSSAFEGLARRSGEYADSLKRAIAEQEKLVANDNVRAMGAGTPLGFPTLPTTWTSGDAARQMGIETESARAKRISDLQRNADLLREANRRGDPNVSGNMVIEAEEKLRQAVEGTTRSVNSQSAAWKQVSTIATDLSRGIANAGVGLLFSRGAQVDVQKYKDEISSLEEEQRKLLVSQSKGNDVTKQLAANSAKLADVNRRMAEETRKASFAFRALEAGKSIVEDLAKSITRVLIEGSLKRLGESLTNVGGIFGKVFGGGTGVVKSVSGGMGDLGGAAKGGIGGAASAASSGLAGIVGAVGSVVSAVSGVIGNFQMAGMNKSLDLIEKEVRYRQIHLLHTLNKANEYWPYMKTCWESLVRMEQRQMSVGGGGGVQNNFAGAYFLTDAAFEDFMQKQARWLKAQGL